MLHGEQDRAVQEGLQLQLEVGAEPVGGTPEEFAAFIRSEQATWRRVIRQADIRL